MRKLLLAVLLSMPSLACAEAPQMEGPAPSLQQQLDSSIAMINRSIIGMSNLIASDQNQIEVLRKRVHELEAQNEALRKRGEAKPDNSANPSE